MTPLARLLGALAVVAALAAPAGSAERLAWPHERLAPALAEAAASGRLVLVKADAAWCPECKTLEAEVFATPAGAALAQRFVAARLDFDHPDNRPAMERYVILGLPTTLVLRADGSEVGRVTGYQGAEQFLAALGAIETRGDVLPALRAAAAARPDDPEALLRLGEALLVRGDPAGEATLERVTWLAAGARPAVAAEALFLLGRFHHRVRRDPATARHLWRELATRYPDQGWAGGAWAWYARAQAELGQPQVGATALRVRAVAEPANAAATRQWVQFLVDQPAFPGREVELKALGAHVERLPEAQRRDLGALVRPLLTR